MEVLLLIIEIFVVFVLGVFFGIWLVLQDEAKEIESNSKDIYCFECEIEMPVKEKNGRYYCSNCKLYHGTQV